MRCFSKLLIVVLLFSLVPNLYAGENPPSNLNLKVGENFYFEGNSVSKNVDDKEESMQEIKRTPFYQTTWFITAVSLIVVAGAGTGVYFLTQKDEGEGYKMEW